ncbi:maleylpyruvate isomerase N-terminal domain-containing protein [Mycolicibacterium sp. XJ1819]
MGIRGTREALADAWERWARRCTALTAAQWSAPTRCIPWDVRALIAHVCPDPAMFDMLTEAVIDGPPAVDDAAELLRLFNEPGGVAHTSAGRVAEQALTDAAKLSPQTVVARFAESAHILRSISTPDSTVISYPVVGSTTLAVITETALMEATVHLLDLADAVGGVTPSDAALTATRDLLIGVPDATAAVEVLAGRADPATALPAVR